MTAPQAGRVAFVSRDTGTIVIHPHADAGVVSVPALVYGTVTALEAAPEPAVVLTAPGLAIAGAWSYGASAWGPLVLWDEPDSPVGAADRSDWEAAVVFRGGAATAALLAAAARQRAAGIVASGSTDLRPGADLHRTTLEVAPAPAVPTLLLYGHLAPTLPDRLLDALRPLASTTVGMASADRSGVTGTAIDRPGGRGAGRTSWPAGAGAGPRRRDPRWQGGGYGRTGCRDGPRTHLFPSEWRWAGGAGGGCGRRDAVGTAGQLGAAADGEAGLGRRA